MGKVVVITGGTAGIGKASAEVFLREGCKVAVCGRSKAKLDAFQEEYAGQDILTVQADVVRAEDMRRLADSAEESFGGIDIWVNNAGIYPFGYLDDMDLEAWNETFRVNVDGVFNGCRAAIPAFRRRGGGVILNAGSYAAITPAATRGAYACSKAAVNQMSRVLAAELGPDNIRVVTYNPGFVLTELNAPQLAEYPRGAIEAQTAQNRLGRPEEVAELIAFLASEKAGFITGCGVEVSGGKFCVQNPSMPWNRHRV